MYTRADPIANEGAIGGHLHTIIGSNNFDIRESYDDARAGTCTTSEIQINLSNYWSAPSDNWLLKTER
jgi:hypothetical protein